MARCLAGRGKPLPPISDQLEWERKRVIEKKGGKEYYSIAPDYESFFELLRSTAGEPVPGTTGRVLPPFDPQWLELWTGMAATKIKRWQQKREEATGVSSIVKAKL